jgi:hypothetical protein
MHPATAVIHVKDVIPANHVIAVKEAVIYANYVIHVN